MRRIILFLSALLIGNGGSLAAQTAPSPPVAGIRIPDQPTPTMPLADVRVGMKGYGKTVFHGSEIEPFACEVVSVISDSSAKRATIWIVCTDERMTQSGPVQGMSGSPIYLWDQDEQGTLGEGGRLIGAFAFGYPSVNVCLVGVQPIEYMREVGGRATDEDLQLNPHRQAGLDIAGRSLASLRAAADASSPPSGFQATRLDAFGRLIDAAGGHRTAPPAQTLTPLAAPTGEASAAVMPLQLPLAVGDPRTADLLAPLLAPAGIRVMAGGLTAVAGTPPSNVDASRVMLEPGSVLSIPLAFGDLDLNAAGTVTDVLPDGTVLAFGHALQAVGSARLPMATGYTHFVVSRTSISFKQAGSLDIVGSIVRDEAAAVAGIRDTAFKAAPVAVRVEMPGQPARDYRYDVVDHIALTPAIVGAVVNGSLTAVQAPPLLHTTHLVGSLTFTGGRTLQLDSLLPGGGMNNLAFELLPPLITMMQNPLEPLHLEAADLTLRIEPRLRQASLVSATLDRPAAAPGESVSVTAAVQPFDGPLTHHTLSLDLPSDLRPGSYQLVVSGAGSYLNRLMMSRPDLMDLDDVDDLLDAMQTLADVNRSALYLSLPRLTPSLASHGNRLPNLPSSRLAVLATPTTTTLQPYPRFVHTIQPTDAIIDGEMTLTLDVRETMR